MTPRGGVSGTHKSLRALALCTVSVCLLREHTEEHIRYGGTSPPSPWETGGSHGLTWSITAPHLRSGMSFKEQLGEAKSACVPSSVDPSARTDFLGFIMDLSGC